MAWCKFPSRWIRDGTLAQLRWWEHGSDGTAALLLLIGIAVAINQETIQRLREADNRSPPSIATDVQLTYDQFEAMTGMSRAKVAAGLAKLRQLGLILAVPTGRTMRYSIPQILTPGDWCQLPQAQVFRRGVLEPFMGFKLREKWELQCLMLYLVLLTFKVNNRATASVSYVKIEEYTGIRRNDIRNCIDHLINLDLIRLEQDDDQSAISLAGNVYRLRGFEQVRAKPTASAGLA